MKNISKTITTGICIQLQTCILVLSLLINPLCISQAQAFSVGEEKKIGEKLLGMVRRSFTLLDDPDINQYINELGNEILTVTGNQFFDYHFFVIDNREFNAFAAPSGLIFIHSGLIETMDNEGELISVMAHECGHVTSRHIADRMKKTSKISIATAAMLIAGIAAGGGALSQALIAGSMATGSSMNLKFSRQDEEEADRLSYKWMEALGTTPAPMATMLQKMHKVSVYRMANIPPYLLTHPEPKRRLNYVQDLLLDDHKAKILPERDNFKFLRIKARILSITKKPASLRALAGRQLEQTDNAPLTTTMAHYALSLAALKDADYSEAKRQLEIVMADLPNRHILQTDMAVISFSKRDFQGALRLFKQAHRLDPNNGFTSFYLAKTLQQLQQNEAALEVYQSLLANFQDYSKLHYQIGQVMTLLGRNGDGHYHLGRYFWYEGNVKMAKLHLSQAITSPATSPVLREEAKKFKEKIIELEKD